MAPRERSIRLKVAVRRIAAFFLDYVIIVAYAGVLFGIALLLADSEVTIEASFVGKLKGHATAFSTLTFPVWVYFTLFESSRTQATLGKLPGWW